MDMTQRDRRKYDFDHEGDELAQIIMEKVRGFQGYAIRKGLAAQWRKNIAFYENEFFASSDDIVDTGAAGELKALAFNHFRNVLRHTYNQVVSQMPAYQVSALNTSVKSRRASKISKNIINYYFNVKRLSKDRARAAELGIVTGDGYVTCEWNPVIGRDISADENDKLIKEGDFEWDSYGPFDVFFDYTKTTKDKWDWVIWRKKLNKFDQAAIHQKQRDKLIGIDSTVSSDPYYADYDTSCYSEIDSPDIYIYYFYHKHCNALPGGKFCKLAGEEDTAFMLHEGKNIYDEQLPIFNVSPGSYLQKSFGFAEANILRSPQMLINCIISSLSTNAIAAGVNNIWTPEGANISVNELVDGLNHLTSATEEMPQVLSFYKDLPGLKDLLSIGINTMETLSAQNAAVRGNVQEAPNLKSGIAIATVINMAQQYGQALAQSANECFEDIASFLIKTLQNVQSTERLIEISGPSNKNYVQTFVKDDIKGVSRVVITQTNPLMNQPSGKIEIAFEMLKIGKIGTDEFFDVVNTGNLEVATESDERLLDFIASAKEMLLEGKMLPPIPGINHQLYIKEIHSLLYDPDIIANDANKQILQNIIATIQQQLDLMRNGDEIANLIYGGKPPTPPQMGNDDIGGGEEQDTGGELSNLSNPNPGLPKQAPELQQQEAPFF
jgi:hypothetical protein